MRARSFFLLLSLGLSTPAFAEGAAATVSLLTGAAQPGTDGKLRPLAVGQEVKVGESVKTQKGAKLELSFPDGSRFRVASDAELVLSDADFSGKKRERISLKLLAGRAWASVVKATGGKDSFEVETKNAVTGVRGTSFAVLAAADASALVRVYTGTVGVRPSAVKKGDRKQVSGPKEIDRRQWEEIVATAMKEVRVSSVGDIAPAQDFEDSGESLEWAQWNQQRDQGK